MNIYYLKRIRKRYDYFYDRERECWRFYDRAKKVADSRRSTYEAALTMCLRWIGTFTLIEVERRHQIRAGNATYRKARKRIKL